MKISSGNFRVFICKLTTNKNKQVNKRDMYSLGQKRYTQRNENSHSIRNYNFLQFIF